jgi:DNA helicase-2/ATP-dependent DNA helicase PcrA
MPDFPNYLKRYTQLNDAQKLAVDTIDGPVLVVAGPGSGKTELLSLRVANILQQTDIEPSSILCLTFTDAAAVNMRARLVGLIGTLGYRVSIHTFHNFGTEIISRHPEYFYHGAAFFPADELVQIAVLEALIEQLPYDNPLRSHHPDQGYVHLGNIRQAIGKLKQAGRTPGEFSAIMEQNSACLAQIQDDIAAVFDATMSTKMFSTVGDLIARLNTYDTGPAPVYGITTLIENVTQSLIRALAEAEVSGKAKPLTGWKSDWTTKDVDGQRILKDTKYLKHMLTLAQIYADYQEQMQAQRYFDFNDMLLDTIQGIERHPDLCYELQERYQYVLVDEFQDTNDAQMRLLHLLTNSEIHEGRPNIMAVGDDDQAIFKFQGAEINNILRFRDRYIDPTIVVLTKNYRSTQHILDLARSVIVQGEERLENLLDEVQKELVAENPTVALGEIHHQRYLTKSHELYGVAKHIRQLLDRGMEAEGIAVIARQHKDLEALVGFLTQFGVPVRYERQQNVLLEPHIHQLIQMVRFAVSLARKSQDEADDLLPEILSYPFWKIDRVVLWKLSVEAAQKRCLWMQCLLEHPDEPLRQIGQFFLEVSQAAHHEPLEFVLERLIGARVAMLDLEEDADILPDEGGSSDAFVSPFKDYYFSSDALREHKGAYVAFLSSLKVFVQALREYKLGQPLLLEDVVTFVNLHMINNIAVTDTSPFVGGAHAIQLMTSHKAKGLEYETVFVLCCQEDVWVGGGHGGKLPFPHNLPIGGAGETLDDALRLFYVAMTRAKSNLYLTGHTMRDDGKESPGIQFLATLDAEHIAEEQLETAKVLSTSWRQYHRPPIVRDEAVLLAPILERYQLSVTDLNSFLDLEREGPDTFLEQHLLRFPQPKNPHSSYGTAVHATIQQIYLHLRTDGDLLTTEAMLDIFSDSLSHQRLSATDLRLFLTRGRDALTTFYAARRDQFRSTDEVERGFSQQDVYVGKAHLTGKIDKLVRLNDHEVSVHDFKTGRALANWQGKDPASKGKLVKYRRQLLFYKLLVEHSRDYGKRFTVPLGVLEFVEPARGALIELPLDLDQESATRVASLAEIVYDKILTLSFPDVSRYDKNTAGSKAFEQDLLDGAI